MNLVTAVLVEGALEHARQEKEQHGMAFGGRFRDLGRVDRTRPLLGKSNTLKGLKAYCI